MSFNPEWWGHLKINSSDSPSIELRGGRTEIWLGRTGARGCEATNYPCKASACKGQELGGPTPPLVLPPLIELTTCREVTIKKHAKDLVWYDIQKLILNWSKLIRMSERTSLAQECNLRCTWLHSLAKDCCPIEICLEIRHARIAFCMSQQNYQLLSTVSKLFRS